ncbi:hypothetical protein BDB00DRAFT_874452 [Zychaea mexicana]|uniref:uncharacterized protein n=1 Tax=Zychaea mexicana TaxID=64656 RepID=UPI0022FF06AE|nr:uncharacterized protein BDB00DRAFT_874452 [Zychaea mexicana]KAI9491384.1 hypothetical protein BDB00DRAFT_874452 [Zychaea mexicana]
MSTSTFRLNEPENNIHSCQYRDKVYATNSNLHRHIREKHTQQVPQNFPAESMYESRETEDSDLGDEGDDFDDTSVIDQGLLLP